MVVTCGLIELELLGATVNEAEFARLSLNLHGFRRLVIEDADWSAAARLGFDLRRGGVTVPFTDILLAALAIRHGVTLLHADTDFDTMAKRCALRVESLVHLRASPS